MVARRLAEPHHAVAHDDGEWLAAGVMPSLNEVIVPAGVMRPIWLTSVCENQMLRRAGHHGVGTGVRCRQRKFGDLAVRS